MSEPMTNRAYVSHDGAQFPAGWMLKSGQPGEPRGPVATVQDGIQFYVSGPGGRVVRLELDVHDAGDLHQALEAHMENVAAGDVKPITPEERDRLLRKDWRKSNLRAVRDEIDNPLRPRLAKDKGEEYTGPRVIVPSDDYRELLAAAQLDPEFLAAMEAVLEAWTGPHRWQGPGGTNPAEVIRSWAPELAAALDRLAELNA